MLNLIFSTQVGGKDVDSMFRATASLSGEKGLRRIGIRTDRWLSRFSPRAEDDDTTVKCIVQVPGLDQRVEIVKLVVQCMYVSFNININDFLSFTKSIKFYSEYLCYDRNLDNISGFTCPFILKIDGLSNILKQVSHKKWMKQTFSKHKSECVYCRPYNTHSHF